MRAYALPPDNEPWSEVRPFVRSSVRSFVRSSVVNFPCEHSTVHNFCPIIFKFDDGLYVPKISIEFDIGENRIQDGRLAAIFVGKI